MRSEFRGVDLVFLFSIIALVVFGLLMVYSTSFIFAAERTGDGYTFIRKQLAFAVAGFAGLWAASRLDYRHLERLGYWIFGGSLLLLALVLVPGLGGKAGGAQRWLELGALRFQPGEIAKFALVVFVARQLARKRERLTSFTAGVLANFVVPLPALALLLAQPDFGTVTIIAAVIFCMMFAAGVPLRYLAATLGALGAAAVVLVLGSPYRKARLMTFLDPWQDPSGSGFQILQSLTGLHNGGVSGVGLGNGRGKLFYLPEAHNDFIFAIIGEELGFIGAAAVAALFCFVVYRGLMIGWRRFSSEGDLFALLLATGLTLVIGLQAFVNMAVVMGLLPTKGLTLP
ncbi:MAG: putative lipid II flippase FtsW, partial [Bdellovibrionales bacterium]|nr:putative lipid II flippase FtsW [Bdellovibrionales bacterium]